MITGFWGKKIGMTQIFTNDGLLVPVTAIDVSNWVVSRLKTEDRDGYVAVQLGHLKSGSAEKEFSVDWIKQPNKYFSFLREVPAVSLDELNVGLPIDIARFLNQGDAIDVFGTTIGRGFQGGVKRHGFAGGPATHGDALGRRPGSIGYMRSRGRVIKGWRMAGHMGCDKRVVKNLKVIDIKADAHVVLIKGSVPGKSGSLVYMRKCR